MKSVSKKTGAKGLITEEIVRRYFLRAGFFVLRGVPVKFQGVDLTDVDIWIYERSATLARRITVIDCKDRKLAKASERLFFIRGLASFLRVEGAGVVTTDDRPILRQIAKFGKVLWIDASDLAGLKASPELAGMDRISEEEFYSLMDDVDRQRQSKLLRNSYVALKGSVAEKFGVNCGNPAIDMVGTYGREAISAHPNSASALVFGRLTYLAAGIACAAYDYASAEWALRPRAERLLNVTDALRYGADKDSTIQRIRTAEAAIRDYVPNGNAAVKAIKEQMQKDLDKIPAEGLAETVVKMATSHELFDAAKELEVSAFRSNVPTFDQLSPTAKSALGALLDFANIERAKFASAWAKAEPRVARPTVAPEQGELGM